MSEIAEDILPTSGVSVINGISVADVSATLQLFGWVDYIVFVFMLLICIVIGLYFYFNKTSNTAQDYLVGGRSMSMFPVSMSLLASYFSGISLLGIPTEIYVYGLQFIYVMGGILLMAIIFQIIFLPVFHELQVTSTYEYLEKRFDRKIRIFGSLLFSIGLLIWLPLVTYIPALAFNQVTGINVHLITPIVCIICIFYTTIGGIKAVVWTDVIQTAFMIGSMLLISIKGTVDVGGLQVIFQRNWDSNRIEAPNIDINPLTRHTLWSLVIGGSIYWLHTSAVNQNMIQRYLSLPTLKTAKGALWIFVLGVCFLVGLSCYSGMLIYATYYKCDPLTTTLAREKDQLLPLLVMEVLGNYPGLPGLFVSGVFSAALSSLSTGLNSMAAIVLEDFYKGIVARKLSDRETYIVMKATVVIVGAVCVGLVFVVEKLGAVLQLSMSIGAITAGPALALFLMGVLFPWITSKGALYGGIAGLGFMSWLCINAQTAIASGGLVFPEKHVSVEECHYHFNPKELKHIQMSFNNTDTEHTEEIFILYRLSYLWYALIGATFTTLVGLAVSFIMTPLDPRDLDKALLTPFVRMLIPARHFPNQPPVDETIYAFQSEGVNISQDTIMTEVCKTESTDVGMS